MAKLKTNVSFLVRYCLAKLAAKEREREVESFLYNCKVVDVGGEGNLLAQWCAYNVL